MKIDEGLINHNALLLIAEAAQNSFKAEECKDAVEYIMGVLDMAERMKEVLRS